MTTMITRRTLNAPSDLWQLSRSLNRLIDEAFQGWPFQRDSDGALTSTWLPAVDVFEERDAVKIVAELPGVRPDDVKLTLENNVLTIRGEKKQQAEERTERVHRYERSYGSFERTFSLPSTVDPERIEATFEHGVLTVTLPKVEQARAKEIPIRTSASTQ